MPAFSTEIMPMQNLGGAVSFPIMEIVEEAGQTFSFGTPVSIASADGGVQAWNGATTAFGIAGVSQVNANNLASTGFGAPSGFSPLTAPASSIGSFAVNANQPAAVFTPPGVPFSTGRTGFIVGGPSIIFSAVIGNAGAAIATNNNQVGVQYGMTKDPVNAFWYVDTSKTGGSAVLVVTAIDRRFPVGTVGGKVWFAFLPGALQVLN